MTWEKLSDGIFSLTSPEGVDYIFRGSRFKSQTDCETVLKEFTNDDIGQKITSFLKTSTGCDLTPGIDCIEFSDGVETKVSFSLVGNGAFSYYAVFYNANCCRIEIDLD